MKRYLLLACFGCLCLLARSQRVVTGVTLEKRDGQLLTGFLQQERTEVTPQSLSFSAVEGGPFRTFAPSEIHRATLTDGTIYESYQVPVYAVNKDYINRSLSDYDAPATGFHLLQSLVPGDASLYLLVDQFQFPHFYVRLKDSSRLAELLYRPYTDASMQFRENAAYRTDVRNLAASASCGKSFDARIDALKYNRGEMVRVFSILNACLTGKTVVPEIWKDKRRLRFGVLGGASWTQQNAHHPSYVTGLSYTSSGWSRGTQFGVFIDGVSQKLRKYTTSVEIVHRSYSDETDTLRNSNFAGKGKISEASIGLLPSARFLLARNRMSPFLELGFQLNYVNRSSYTFGWKYASFSGGGSEHFDYPKTFSIYVVGGAGMDLGRVSLHLRYGTGFGLLDPTNYLALQARVSMVK